MKKAVFVLLASLLVGHTVSLLAAAQQQDATNALRNSDIVGMVEAELSSEIVIAKIKSSYCSFDTFPSVLKELKNKGVSNEIILAMVEAPYGPPKIIAQPPTRTTAHEPPASHRESATPQMETAREAPETVSNVPEYGSLSEIQYKRAAYVYTEDFNARKIIVKELESKGFTVSGRIEDADFIILFADSIASTGVTPFLNNYLEDTEQVGEFVVIKRVKTNGVIRPRILWTTRKVRLSTGGMTLNRHPATNATRDFIKALNEF